jgi:hypothetical protein
MAIMPSCKRASTAGFQAMPPPEGLLSRLTHEGIVVSSACAGEQPPRLGQHFSSVPAF